MRRRGERQREKATRIECRKLIAPNHETVRALRAAEEGQLETFVTLDELVRDVKPPVTPPPLRSQMLAQHLPRKRGRKASG